MARGARVGGSSRVPRAGLSPSLVRFLASGRALSRPVGRRFVVGGRARGVRSCSRPGPRCSAWALRAVRPPVSLASFWLGGCSVRAVLGCSPFFAVVAPPLFLAALWFWCAVL